MSFYWNALNRKGRKVLRKWCKVFSPRIHEFKSSKIVKK
jgi:hypothetical protein